MPVGVGAGGSRRGSSDGALPCQGEFRGRGRVLGTVRAVKSFNEIRFDVRRSSDGWLTVHCTSDVLPEEWVDTVSPETIEQIRLLRARLGEHKITEAELVRLGLLVGDALVPKNLQVPLSSLVSATPSDEVLRLRIVTHDVDLAAIPWEYVRLRSDLDDMGGPPLALDERVSVLRSPLSTPTVAAPALRCQSDLRVLHASTTEVAGFRTLRGDEDAVDLALWGGGGRRTRRVVVDRLSDPATRESLEGSLAAGPDILVFTGHCAMHRDRPALILADDQGQPDPVTGGELASMLLRSGTPLVVLNACDTATSDEAGVSLAELLVRSGVETTIGMQMPISDSNAGQFAVGMIGSLGEGASIDVAVSNGRRRVADRAGYAEWGVPTLVTSSRTSEPPHDGPRSGVSGRVPASRPEEQLADATRGGSIGGSDRPLRWAWAIGLVTVIALAVGATAWAMGSDGDDESAGAATSSSRATVEEQADDGSPVQLEDPDSYEFAGRTITFERGISDAEPVNRSDVSDTSPALRARLDAFEATAVSPALQAPGGARVDLDARDADWPMTPAIGTLGSQNGERNPDCRRVILTKALTTGIAGRAWFANGHYVMVNSQELVDAPSARRWFWATSLFVGLHPGQCSGWPSSGVAVNPTHLSVDRRDFDLDGPAEDVLTASGTEFVEVPAVQQANSVVFRQNRRVVVATVGVLDKTLFDSEATKRVLSTVMRTFAEG